MRTLHLVSGICLALSLAPALAGWPAEDLPRQESGGQEEGAPFESTPDTAPAYSDDPNVLFGQVCQWAVSNLAFAEQQGGGTDLANYLAKISVSELVTPEQPTLRGALTRVLVDLQIRLESEPAHRRELVCSREMAATAGLVKQHWQSCHTLSIAVGQAIEGQPVDDTVLDRAVPAWRELTKIFSPAESEMAASAFNRWCLVNGRRGYTFASQNAD